MFPFFSLSLLSLLLSFCVGEMSFFSRSIGFEGGVESCDPLSRQGPIEGASNRLKGVFNAENNFPPVLILVPPPPCLWLHLSVNSLRLSGSPYLCFALSFCAFFWPPVSGEFGHYKPRPYFSTLSLDHHHHHHLLLLLLLLLFLFLLLLPPLAIRHVQLFFFAA